MKRYIINDNLNDITDKSELTQHLFLHKVFGGIKR